MLGCIALRLRPNPLLNSLPRHACYCEWLPTLLCSRRRALLPRSLTDCHRFSAQTWSLLLAHCGDCDPLRLASSMQPLKSSFQEEVGTEIVV